eukprot:TRINITY_DN9095_c0_g1_i1.p1 TRINITY_DN9095_c0_g1~~TRINITY_DN9095_c0_g1_i1.p1  ORF type:complete len:263 (-),score=39.41 TRINITY_DN9095_c0_g1_i1:30-818(-)
MERLPLVAYPQPYQMFHCRDYQFYSEDSPVYHKFSNCNQEHWKEFLPSFAVLDGYSKPILPPPTPVLSTSRPSTPTAPLTQETPIPSPQPQDLEDEDRSDDESDSSSGSSSSSEDQASGKKRPTWLERFNQLKEFKENYGHCKVPYRWAENPGLGRWVGLMRKKMKDGRLEDEKKQMLQSISFSWSLVGCRTRLLKRERSASIDVTSATEIPTDDTRRSFSIPFKKRKIDIVNSTSEKCSKDVTSCNITPDTQLWMSRYLSL